MPELPEIETIKSDLASLLKNKQILQVKINLPKQIQGTSAKIFIKKVSGTKIISVRRRAKMLIIDLDSGYHLVFHLKMTGQLIYQDKNKLAGGGHPIRHSLENLPNKYSHVIFIFSENSHLFFNDTRQFGWVKLITPSELNLLDRQHGPEPLDISFTFDKFKQIFTGKKGAIKSLLMDGKFIAGVGNIYAQEALFCANIHPERKANTLTAVELKKLYKCLTHILKLAIAKKGTSSSDYVDAFGRRGSMSNYLKVYGRGGLPCKKCGRPLKQIRQAQRSTVFCSVCQK